ncbi:NAD-dependent dehydratase [Methylophaga thalassica]|uniref:UDP-glucose 4-epimerase n=1 Tax=Methylophaga thalassica TaxID=40223 RepID=A0ABQ5TZ62_9GAMM|nr:NAD-dependent epimerase/dehydratase family protein [Methylophaga thalassica]GLP99815.1 NAD-dependent dehydratase [Methylophaga thalassica]
MKVLVLGGSGFLGKHIVRKLIEDSHQVTVFGRQADKIDIPGVKTVSADFSDTLSLSESLIGVDKVVHLISTSVPSTSNRDPISDIQGNLVNTVKLLEMMKQSGLKDIVYFSSGGTVYGHPQTIPISESHANAPVCSYGVVKLAIEKYLHMYSDLYDFNTVILRPSNPFGPGQTHTGVQGFIGTCIAAALSDNSLTIWGDGSVKRDYVFAEDVAEATISALNYQGSDNFNISSGEGVSLNEIIELVQQETGKSITVNYQAKRDFDIPEIILNNEKARRLLNWQPSTSFTTGLSLTVRNALTMS